MVSVNRGTKFGAVVLFRQAIRQISGYCNSDACLSRPGETETVVQNTYVNAPRHGETRVQLVQRIHGSDLFHHRDVRAGVSPCTRGHNHGIPEQMDPSEKLDNKL
jgi:hypothetical protein